MDAVTTAREQRRKTNPVFNDRKLKLGTFSTNLGGGCAISTIDGTLKLSATLASQERTIIEEALRATGGRVYGPSGAATRLGVPRSTLESRIRTLKIDKTRFRA